MGQHRTPSGGRVMEFVLSTICPNAPRNLPEAIMDAWQVESGSIPRVIYKALIPGPGLQFLAPVAVKQLVVPVNYDLSWDQALIAGSYQRQDHVDITKVAVYYPDGDKKGIVDTKVILVNFGDTSDAESVLAWGFGNHMRPVNPRECFAIGATYPKLNDELDGSGLVIWSLDYCYIEETELACWTLINGAESRATVTWSPLGLAPGAWIGFVYENSWMFKGLTSLADKPLPKAISV